MKKERGTVYAFIDANNLHLGTVKNLGWKIDYRKFRVWLKDKYNVSVAYMFIGYIKENTPLYDFLRDCSYELIFKPTIEDGNEKIKGNIDADLVLQAMIDFSKYDKAIIISNDGDFYSLVRYLRKNGKLLYVMSPYRKTLSTLLKREAREKILLIEQLKDKLEYKK